MAKLGKRKISVSSSIDHTQRLGFEVEVNVSKDGQFYFSLDADQMKTLLDRLNPLYTSDYHFRRVYMLSTAAEDEPTTPQKAETGLLGWVDCFEKAQLAGCLFCGGIDKPGEAAGKNEELEEAYEFGKNIQ